MVSALFYLQWHSFRNRMLSRIKRLKQPKYLAAALVGGAYFYWYFFRFLFHAAGGRQTLNGAWSPENLQLIESLGALALFVTVALSWLIPHERAALTFTEAEIAFLFPAPVSRRGLIHFKLLRSQTRIFFSAVILTLFTRRFGGNVLNHALGWWLIFSILNLHFLGASFARTLLLDRGVSNWLRRLVVGGILLAAAGAAIVWAKQSLPELSGADKADFRSLANYAQRVLDSGPGPYLLYPFRLAVRPYLAPDAAAFLLAAGPALLLYALHYWWVIRSNVSFEEASVEASQKQAARIAAVRAGNWRGTAKRKGKRPFFQLAAAGPPATALFWKNLISSGQAFTPRIWISVLVMTVFVSFGISNGGHNTDVFMILTIIAGVLLAWSVFIGPQLLRQDLRQDIELADVLKSYPMRGWQIVLGELLAPAAILSVAQWLLLIFGTTCLVLSHELKDTAMVLAIASAAMLLLPLLDLILLLIPNAAVLLFPSWIQVGKDGPRGIEATGQRLIFMLGQLVTFSVALIPAAAVFGLVLFLIQLVLHLAAAVVLASLAAMVMLAAEAGLGVVLLGRFFERFDLSSETTN